MRVGVYRPKRVSSGSDVANLSVFGYDPASCYTGRAPIEAASMGVHLNPEDIAFRLNLVTLIANYGKIYMDDFSAGHITTAEAKEIIATLQTELGGDDFHFYPGVSYRHLMVWRGGVINSPSRRHMISAGNRSTIICRKGTALKS